MGRNFIRIHWTENEYEHGKKQASNRNVSSTEEDDVAKPTAKFPKVDLKDYDNAEKILHYIQVNLKHAIEKPKTKNTKRKKTSGKLTSILLLT